MARWFEFKNPELETPTLGALRAEWTKIPDLKARNAIAEKCQYLYFHRVMVVDGVHSWSHSPEERENWFTPTDLTLSVRAGAISAAIAVGSSIVECALRAHAEAQGITLPKRANKRTFGKVYYGWKGNNKKAGIIAPIMDDLELLIEKRNHIHLHESDEEGWEKLLEEEIEILNAVDRAMEFLRDLDPPDF